MIRACRELEKRLSASILLLLFSVSAHAATITVTSSADSGAGTLRQALADAANGDVITFNLAYPATINLSSQLALMNKSLTITGPGAAKLAISGQDTCRVIIATGGSNTITGIAITNGRYEGSGELGGGVYITSGTLLLDQCVIQNNHYSLVTSSYNGGGGIGIGGGYLTVNRCLLQNNAASGLFVDAYGGAINNKGTLRVLNSCVLNNSASYSGAIINQGSMSLFNSTISGNQAALDYGTVYNRSGYAEIVNCTIMDNYSNDHAGGLFISGNVTLRNTVLARNASANPSGNSDLQGSIMTSLGHNVIGSNGSGSYTWLASDNVGWESSRLDPQLWGLAENGGYLPTYLPKAGSLVINPVGDTLAPWVDSRGYLRNGTGDKGACEYEGTLPVALPADWLSLTAFTAHWQAVAGAESYALDVATDAAFDAYVSGWGNSLVGNTTSVDIAGLTPGTTYYYRIRAINGEYQTYHSNTITYIAPIPTPTATLTPIATLTPTSTPRNPLVDVDMTGRLALAFPNPAQDQVRFLLAPDRPVRVKIILLNLAGERVGTVEDALPAGRGTVVWDCRGVAPGLYMARVVLDGKELTKLKIAVIR